VTAALDAAVSEGYYEEGEPEEEGASPLVLILGWVLFGVAIVCIGAMAYFLRIYYVQLRDAGDPAKLKADNIRLWKQLEGERESARTVAERRDALVAENDGLTVQVTDLKRELAKGKAAAQASSGRLSGLEGQLKVSERAAADLKEKLREFEARSREAQADGTQALSQILACRQALRSIELLERPARWGEALAQLNKAIRSGEGLKEARWLRGALLVKLRRPKEALQDFEALDELARRDNAAGHVKALVAAGDVCRTQLDDRGRAKEYYRSAAKAAAASPYGKLAQARLDVLDGNAQQARRSLEQEVRAVEAAGEDYAPLCVLLAEILAASQDGRDEAVRQATKAVVADPANAPALDIRAGLLVKKGQLEQAAADLMRAKEINPFDNDRLVTLGSLLADLKRHDQANAILGVALKADPGSAEAMIALGKALVGLERHDEAIKLATSAMKIAADSGDAYLVRGQASIALGHYREGLRDLEAAIRFGRDDARARITLARTYGTATGTKYFDPEKALAHAKVAVDLTERRDADALAALGIAYAAGNDFVKSAAEMRQAFALAPHNDAYRKLLAEYQRKAR
jgi:Tfp pilus assembly protein PilF